MKFILAIFILCFSASSFGIEMEAGVGLNYTNFDYKEDLPSPYKSNEAATFWAPTLSLGAKVFDESIIYAKYTWSGYINSNYDGSTLSGAPFSGVNDLAFSDIQTEARLNLAKNWNFLVGGGYRVWDRILNSSSTYKETYIWNYIYTGVAWSFWQGDAKGLGVDVIVKSAFNGTMKIDTSSYVSGGENSEVNLGSRTGYALKFPFQHLYWSPKWGYQITPWYEVSEIGQSNVVPNATLSPTAGTGIYEPSSRTVQYGIEFLMQFGF